MSRAYLGLYWTLPVNWAGFRRLPANVDDAAAASRTIRYQRERVRRYVAEEKGTLLDEIAFIDVQPDRATDVVQGELNARAARYAGRAILLFVRFADVHHWRNNAYMLDAAQQLGLEVLPLPPDPITIDGRLFDPILHFANWRQRDRSTKARLKLEAHQALRAALAITPEGNGRWEAIAASLAAQGVRTLTGRSWSAENVRKLARRIMPNEVCKGKFR